MRVKIRSLRSDLADVLRIANEKPVTVVRYGEPVAVILSVEEFNRLSGCVHVASKPRTHPVAFR